MATAYEYTDTYCIEQSGWKENLSGLFCLRGATGTETISGRVYVRQYGYVEVTTTSTPLNYTSSSQENPDSGGPVILAGAGGSKAKITPISILNVTIDVDADGNNIYEYTATYAWNNLSGPPVGP
jgi:hypothetical protein